LSAGTAVSFSTDATTQPYKKENAAFFALATLCWPILYFVAYKYTTDTNYYRGESVVVPIHLRSEKGVDVTANHPISTEASESSKANEKILSAGP
jgi:hypothetical protein